LNSNNVINKIQ